MEESEMTEFEGEIKSSPILNAAIAMHELFLTLRAAGFTEHQALIIVSESVRPRNNGS